MCVREIIRGRRRQRVCEGERGVGDRVCEGESGGGGRIHTSMPFPLQDALAAGETRRQLHLDVDKTRQGT